jgi:hypothetical protein
MRREDFEHVIAAAAEVSGEDEFVVVGSQAILGTYPKAPETMLRSMEADIYPRRSPGKSVTLHGMCAVRSAADQAPSVAWAVSASSTVAVASSLVDGRP